MNLAFFDTETGGLDPRRNPLLSIGAVVSGGDAFEAAIQPCPTLIIEKEAADVNGWPWTDRELYPEKEVIQAFVDWHKSHKIKFLVAHNAPFDYAFLGAAISRSGLSVRDMPRFICTMSLAHVLQLQGRINPATLSLNNVAKALNLRITRGEHHGALEDATIVEQVYNAMVEPPKSVVQVHQGPRRRTGLGWGSGM
jgi:DNA polymerase III epsilon subunit-like protein